MLDYGEDALKETSDDVLGRLSKLAEKQADAEAEVARLETDLKSAIERLNEIAEREIPSLMDEVGVKEFKTSSGLSIIIDEKMRASIPKARSGEAVAWLEANGHADLVKRKIVIEFNKDEEERAKEFMAKIAEDNLRVSDENTVHPQTLSAFVKEQLKKGVDVPMELFGAFWQRKSKIK